MMNKLNKTTQKAINWIRQYEKSDCYSVNRFYGRCSSTKIEIEEGLLSKVRENNCLGYKILSGNCFHFVAGYMSSDRKILYIETMSNTFEIAL